MLHDIIMIITSHKQTGFIRSVRLIRAICLQNRFRSNYPKISEVLITVFWINKQLTVKSVKKIYLQKNICILYYVDLNVIELTDEKAKHLNE